MLSSYPYVGLRSTWEWGDSCAANMCMYRHTQVGADTLLSEGQTVYKGGGDGA